MELVFFGMIGILGLWMREVHNSRQVTVKVVAEKVNKKCIKKEMRKAAIKRFLRK